MNLNIFNRVSNLEKLLFTKHLYIMLKSGVPIYDALETLSDTKSKYLKKVLKNVMEDVANGKNLYESLKKYPAVFDNFYISLVKISEQSGSLEETLYFLSEQIAKDYALKQKIKGAMFYPTLIVIAAFGVGGFISLVILPQLVEFFESLEMELPLTTKILLWFATLMKEHGILIIGGTIGAFILLKLLLNSKPVKPIWHAVQLRIPIFGKIILYGELARTCRNFATLLKSGVPATSGLKTTAEAQNNVVFQKDLAEIEEYLEKGKSISYSLEHGHYKEFPQMVVKMIKVGEETGNLEEVLIYMSEFYEEEIDNITKNLTTVLEPILLIGIGIMVGFIAIAIIGPIYKLTGSIK